MGPQAGSNDHPQQGNYDTTVEPGSAWSWVPRIVFVVPRRRTRQRREGWYSSAMSWVILCIYESA